MEKYNITEENLAGKSNNQMKQIMKSIVNNHTKETIIANRTNKSKVKHILDHDGYKQKGNMEGPYMLTMSKAQCSAIFAVRTRMLNVKGNYPSKHTDMKCRWCNGEEESQVHIMEQCPHFMTTAQHINMQSIMNKERIITKTQANHIAKLHNEIQECTNKQQETNHVTHMMQLNDATQ